MNESSSHCKDSDRPLLSDAAMIEESAAGVDGSSSKNDDGMDRKQQSTTMPTSHEEEKKKSDKSIKARSEEGSMVSPPYFIAPVDGLLVTNKPLAWEMKATLSLGIDIQTQGNRSDMMERADEKSHIDVTSKKKDDSSNINGESIHTIDATDEKKADVKAAPSSSSSLHLHLPLLFSLACKISAKSVEKKTNEYVNVQTVWLKAKRDGEATIEHGKGRNRKEEEKGEDEQGKRKVEIKSRSGNDGSSGDDKLTDASGAIVKDDDATAVESNDASSMMSHPVQPPTTSVAAHDHPSHIHAHPHSHPPLRLMQQIRPATSYSSGSVSAAKRRTKMDAAASMNTLATMDGSVTAAAATADIKTEHDDEASMTGGVSVSAAAPSSISAITSAASSSPSASPSAPLISSSSRIQRRAAMHATRINADIMKGRDMNDIKRAEMKEKNERGEEKNEKDEKMKEKDEEAPAIPSVAGATATTTAATMNISPVSSPALNSFALSHEGNDDDVMSSLAATSSSSPVELLDEEKDRTIGTAHIITKKPCNDADGSMDAACMTACQTVIDKMRRGSEGSNIDAESLSQLLQPLIDSLYVTVSPLSPGHGVADDVGFLTHVTTKGGVSAKRQKQKYILFQSGFPYRISLPSLPHPFHLTVHRLQLRSWIWEVKPIKILNMTNNAASSSESSSPLLPVVPLIHMMTMQQKASHRHHHASNNTFNGVSASRQSRSAKSSTAASKKRKRMKTENDENEAEGESWTPNAAHNQSGKRMMKGSAAIVEGRSATSSASSNVHHGSVSSIRSSSTGRLMRSSAIAAAAAVRSILTNGSSQDEYAEYGDGTDDGDPTSSMHASDSPVAAIPLFKRSLTTLIHATETVKGTKVKDGKKQNESAETDTTKKGNSSKHSSVKSSKGGNESKRRHIDNGNPTATTKMDDGNHRSNHASAAYPSTASPSTREKKQQRKTTSHVGLSSSLLIAVEQARAEDGNANISVGSRSWSKKKTKKDDQRGKKRKQQTILTVAGIVAPPSTSIPSASIIQPAMKNKKKRRQIKSKSKVMHPVDLVRSNAATAASSVSTQQQSMSYSMAMMDDAATSFPMGVNMSMNGMNGDMMQSSASSSLDEMSRMHSIGGMSGMQLQPFMSHHQLFSMPSAAAAAAASPLHSSSAFTSLHTTAAAASMPRLLMVNSHGSPDGSSSRSARTSLHTNILSPLPAIDGSEHVQNGGNNSYVTTMTRGNIAFRSICHPPTASMSSGAADESISSNQSTMPTSLSAPLQRPQPIRPSRGNGSRDGSMATAAMSGRESGSDCHTPGAASISAGMLSTPKFVASPSSNTFMSGLSPSIRSSTSPAVPSARGGSAASSLPPLPPSSSPARGTGAAFSPYRSSAFSSYLAAGTSDGDGASVSQRLSLASSSPPTALSAAATTASTGLSLNSASPVLLHGMTAHAQRSEPTLSMSRNIGNGNGNVSVDEYDGSGNTNVSVISMHPALGLAKLARRLPIDGLPSTASVSVNAARPNASQRAIEPHHCQQHAIGQRNNMMESLFFTPSPAAASTPSSALMTHAAASMTTADHSSPMHDMSSSNHPVAPVASIHDASSFHVDGTIVEEGDE